MKTTKILKPTKQSTAEHRQEARQPYKCRQKVAFGTWKVVPPTDAFIEVEFVDLSASGCSFLFDSIATSNDLLIELGMPPRLMHVQAMVKHMTPETLGGKFMCVVGCQFTGRLA